MSANSTATRRQNTASSVDLAVKCNVFLFVIIGVYAAVVRSTPMDLTTSVDGEKLPNIFQETCQWEQFEPECRPETVIIIDSANYGRRVRHLRQQQQQQSLASWGVVGSRPVTDLPPMSSSGAAAGRCIERFYDEADCLADVTQYVASRCSGRRRCSISLPDAVLESSNHRCPRDLKANLEVTYHCLPVHGGYTSQASSVNDSAVAAVSQPKSSLWCNHSAVVVTSSRGFLASVSAQENGAGSQSCPWTIQALPGQTIKLAIYYFNADVTGDAFQTSGVGRNPRQRFDNSRNHVPSPCFDATVAHAAVSEDMTSSSALKALCPPIRLDPLTSRDPAVYESSGNIIHVTVNNMAPAAYEESYFVMRFEVSGCADFVPPIGSAVERSAGTARLRCLSVEELAAASLSSTTTATLVGSRDRSNADASVRQSQQQQQQQRWSFLTCVDGNWSIPVETINCVEGRIVIGGLMSSSTSGPWFDMTGYSLSKQGFLVIVVVGIALVVSLSIIVVGIICLCRSQGLHRQSSSSCRQDLPYISGSSSFRRGGSGKTYDASLTSGGHTSDWRNYDPTWKELQPMLTSGSSPVQGGSKCPSISARVRLMNSGGTGEYGWTCPSSELGSVGFLDGFPHQDHLERDYATTLQMRRTAVPSSVNFPTSLQRDFDLQHQISPHHQHNHHRHHHHHHQSGRRRPQLTAAASSCICPMHGTPSVADRWAGHHRQQQAWTTDVDSCSIARSTATRDCDDSTRIGSSNNNNNNSDEVGPTRFSTFRPHVEHIYEVPRFDDVGGGSGYGCDDAVVTDDVGRKTLEDCEEPESHPVGTSLNDVDADGRPVPYYRELEPTVFGNAGVRLPIPGQSATGTTGNY